MGKILFASNSVSHFPGSVIGNTYFDVDRVPYSIEMPQQTVASSPKLAVTTTQETWFHFTVSKASWSTTSEEPIIEIVDEDGVRIFLVAYRNSGTFGYTMRGNVDGNITYEQRWIPMLAGQVRTMDIRIRQTALLFTYEVYVNELLVNAESFAIGSFRNIKAFWLGGASSGSTYYSEIIVSDADTRNARLDLLRPLAVGHYEQWAGPVSALADDDPTTGMTTVSPNLRQTTVLTPYAGATNISNVVQMTQTIRGINAPTQLKHTIRLSGVDYDSAAFTVPFAKEYQITDWSLNPATSLPWTASDLALCEFGFQSLV